MTTLRRQVKNMVKNYSEAEVKVREATSNDPWGPSSTLMSEISDLTYNIVALGEVMRMIWKRLNDHGKNWRHVYKSLVLLDYLIKNGNEKVAQQCKEHIVAIQTLKDFQYMDEQKDQGASVREKAKQLVNLLRDDERLKSERSKAFRARERYAQNAMGISSDNKIIYATSNPVKYPGASSKSNGSSYADPYGGAGTVPPNANLAPEIEAVRPSDANEEDLQIKLAIMLSQQEHEEEVQRKRADEAKLQIALEQSKSEGQPNGLVDLGENDPWSSNNNNNQKHTDTDSDDLFPPLSSLKPGGQAQLNDPWATTNNTNVNKTNGSLLNDPWATNATNTNPWLPTQQSTSSTSSASNIDPWATNNAKANVKLDDFDLFTTNRVNTPTNTTNSLVNNNSNKANDPFGDFFGGTGSANTSDNKNNSTNPWNNTVNSPTAASSIANDPFGNVEKNLQTNNANNNNNNNKTRKTPESFLGENSSLVNLENLIPSRPKSTNPFGSGINQPMSGASNGLTSSTSSGQLNNPFLAQQQQNQKGPTISQLQQQSMFPFGQPNAARQAAATPPVMQPLIPTATTTTTGQLAQPLIIPPQFNQPFMSQTTPAPSTFNFANSFNMNAGQPTSQPTQNNTTNPFLMM